MKKIIACLCALIMIFGLTACTNDEPNKVENNGNEQTHQTEEVDVESLFKRPADYSPRNGVKKEWNNVCSYFCNYGAFQDEMLDYDVAIIGEGMVGTFNKFNLGSPKVDLAGIKKLKDAGVWTVAYITLGEDYALNIGDGLGPGGYASYYLYDEEGMPRANGAWGSYYVDPANPVWEKIILTEVQRIVDAGCDGIFMDTCDSVDAYPETKNDMVNLIRTIRKEFPDIKMVLNRGFTIIPVVYDIIDGNMFELFATALDPNTFTYGMLDTSSATFDYNRYNGVQVVNATRQAHYYPVFALEYLPLDSRDDIKQQVYNRCWEYDFIPYLSMNGRVLDGTMAPFDLRPTSERGVKALSINDGINVNKNGDTSENNLAYKGNGCSITVDSSFYGYTRHSINDGYVSTEANFDDLGWQIANWASNELPEEHFIELKLKNSVKANKLVIDWAFDNGLYFSSRTVVIEAYINNEWVEVCRLENIDNESVRSEITLDLTSETNLYKIVQPKGMGPSTRKNLMWVTEISLYA